MKMAMHQTTMLRTTMGMGTSILGAITAWMPHIEAAIRVGAGLVAMVAGIYAILNYRADLKHKKQVYENNEINTRTGSTGGNPDRLHGDEGD